MIHRFATGVPRWSRSTAQRAALLAAMALLGSACSGSAGDAAPSTTARRPSTAATPATTTTSPPASSVRLDLYPGMPPVPDPADVYATTSSGRLSPVVAEDLRRVYVPNGSSGTVSVIDQDSKEVVATVAAGRLPQHVVPSYDLRTLWVLDNSGNALVPIDPRTSEPGPRVPVTDPYNLYFTPDGAEAIVVAERLTRLDFRDAHTMALHSSLQLPCPGINHIDFTVDGRFLIATCEFGGRLVKVDLAARKLVGELDLGQGDGNAMPQDVRIAPDGSVFYVADMMAGGVWIIDAASFTSTGFLATGPGAHGLYPSRDGTRLYVANRGSPSLSAHPPKGPGSVTVIDFASRQVVANWPVPGGGSPDMGNVSADGSELWLSGRYDSEVYVFDTSTGAVKARIPVGDGPHGLTVWPQPGRYSLGHTGNMR